MLVLTRKQNEEIVIGDNIKVTVLQIKGNSIRLGIDAPKQIRIVRGELPIKEERQLSEVTVVFSDSRNEAGTQVDIVPFRNSENRNSEKVEATPGSTDSKSSSADSRTGSRAGVPDSISYRQRLPESLQRNRLQQIVNEIARR